MTATPVELATPDHENVLGFSNRWYRSARETATWHAIGEGANDRVRVVDAPHFIATKLEAFRGRGAGDFYHHDMEDIVAVVDGRAELVDELTSAPDDVRIFIAGEIEALMADERFREALPGHLAGDRASQARSPIVVSRLELMAGFQSSKPDPG